MTVSNLSSQVTRQLGSTPFFIAANRVKTVPAFCADRIPKDTIDFILLFLELVEKVVGRKFCCQLGEFLKILKTPIAFHFVKRGHSGGITFHLDQLVIFLSTGSKLGCCIAVVSAFVELKSFSKLRRLQEIDRATEQTLLPLHKSLLSFTPEEL